MTKSVRIGGVHHAGGNHDIGSFRQPTTSQPKHIISVVDLDHRAPQKVVVKREPPTPTAPAVYLLWWENAQLFFTTDREVRCWLAEHRFVKQRPTKRTAAR